MSLGHDYKAAGRAFRDRCLKFLWSAEADATCPPYIVWYRHDCQEGLSWAMYLGQHYCLSPAAGDVPEGYFAFSWRQGECHRCGLRVRSGTGRFTLAEGLALEKGAVREPRAADGHIPEGQAGDEGTPGLVGSASV